MPGGSEQTTRLVIRARMTKEEYSNQGLRDGGEVFFQIRQFRVLAQEQAALGAESDFASQPPPVIGENI